MNSAAALLSHLLPFLRERRYRPGERLPSERELADRFGVSRNLLREALSVLEALRFIDRRPQSGIYLKDPARDASMDMLVLEGDLGMPLSPSDVRDLSEFRSMLERHAVQVACERRSAADVARIDRVLDESRRRQAKGQSLADQDAQFHLALCEAGHNPLVVRAANAFALASRRRRELYFADPRNGARSLKEHRALRDAIAQGDADLALERLGQHLGKVERYWLGTLAADRPPT